MTLNNAQLALTRVAEFRDRLAGAYGSQDAQHEEHCSAARRLLPLVRQIAQRLDPSLFAMLECLDLDMNYADIREGQAVADMLIGTLTYASDADEILGPSGPVLAASGLHEWVWDAAKGYWDDGYYEEAVQHAAEVVNHKTRLKLGRRDISGKTVYQQAFSLDDAKPAAPRLRLTFVDEDDVEAWNSAHEGARGLGEACSQGFRNLVAHDNADLNEQAALEQLGALSTLARWVDDSEVRVADLN